jgi:antitoxin ParD1/3/4
MVAEAGGAAMRRPFACGLSYLLLTDKKDDSVCFAIEGRKSMTTVTISLPDSLKEFVDTQVATKGYGNVSEYFRSLLREAQQNEADARLEALLLEGLASGDPIPVTKEFWDNLRVRTEKIVEKHSARKTKP